MDVAAVLSNNSLRVTQPKACAFSDSLCDEKWLEDMAPDFIGNSGTVISNLHHNAVFLPGSSNARGVFFAVQKALPLMKDGGSIILTGSGLWQKRVPIHPTYAATKAALRSFVRTWTADLAGKGTRANVINPGPVETPILKGQFGENTER